MSKHTRFTHNATQDTPQLVQSFSMKGKGLSPLVMALAASLVIPVNVSADDAAPWSYKGRTGANEWGNLHESYKLCESGKNQSPINIESAKALDVDLGKLAFNYSMLIPDEMHHTGSTLRVDMGLGSSIKFDGKEFELKYFTFHSPGEHKVNGKQFPMEVQFVHQSREGINAVVSMLFIPGAADRTLNSVFGAMPKQAGGKAKLGNKSLKTIEMEQKTDNFYYYNGSLSTPPCTEGTHRFIMKTPMSIDDKQLQYFQYYMADDNARPVQPLNIRRVME